MANVSTAPIQARWESDASHDFAAGVYAKGYGTVDNRIATQTRRVLFVKPDLFVVADTMVPNDAATHTYQARWNLLTTHTHFNPATKTVTTTTPDASNLAVVPLATDGLEVRSASAQTTPEILGWRIEVDPKRTPTTTVLQTRKGTGTQAFLTLFVPLRAGTADPVRSVKPTGAGAAEVVLADGRKLAITAGTEPAAGIEVKETLANGNPGRDVKGGEVQP
jgi:hypothetical protein